MAGASRYFKKLVGEKCYLSPISAEDAETYVRWLNDLEVAQYLTLAHQVITVAAEKELLQKLSGEGQNFAVVDRKTDKLIGGCGLINPDHLNRIAEVGLFIGEKSFWNRGYGQEVLRLLLDYGFNILNLNNIMLTAYAFNTRAIRCYEKAGFKPIGRRRQARRIHGKSWDILYMDILAEEFNGSTLPALAPPG